VLPILSVTAPKDGYDTADYTGVHPDYGTVRI
jgi:glycosidase